MRFLIALLVCLCAQAQTVISGGVDIRGTLTASGAAHTSPLKVGILSSKPATCTTGEVYFATDATAGQNIYGCTASNTWTLQSGGGSSGTAIQKGDGSGGLTAATAGVDYQVPPNTLATTGTTPTCDLGSDHSVTLCTQTLSANVTGAQFNNLFAGARFSWAWTQSAGTYTVAYSGATNTCDVSPTSTVVTTQRFYSPDGVTVIGDGCNSTEGKILFYGPEGSATTTTGSGIGAMTFDSSSHSVTYYANNSSNRHVMPRVASGDQVDFGDLTGTATGTQLPDPTGTTKGGVKSIDCTGIGHVLSVGATPTCSADAGGGTGVGRKNLTATWTAITDMTCQDQTVTWTGITTGDSVILGPPSTFALTAIAFVSAADTVTVRICNDSGSSNTPGSLTFKGTLAVYNLSGTGTINFTSIPDGTCATNTFSLTGVSAGDPVTPKWPSTLESDLYGTMIATASDTVTVRLCNDHGAAIDPASQTFGASVAK